MLIEVFCKALTSAYQQIVNLAIDDTLLRLVKILLDLAANLSRPTGAEVELPMYLTQEDVAHMVTARRERISTALNFLRRKEVIRYSTRGRLVLNLERLRAYLT